MGNVYNSRKRKYKWPSNIWRDGHFTLKKNSTKITLYWYHFPSIDGPKSTALETICRSYREISISNCSWLKCKLPLTFTKDNTEGSISKLQKHSPSGPPIPFTETVSAYWCHPQIGTCHRCLPSTSIRIKSCSATAADLQHPLRKPRVESRNEALCARGKLTRQIFRE